MSEPAYTPRAEYQCDGSTTHYQGCKCHEARHNIEVERLREALRNVSEELLNLAQHHLKAPGNLTQEQKVWSRDTILVAHSWITNFVIKPALEEDAAPRAESQESK